MRYTDYDFYKNTYYGELIEESSFDKWKERAEEKVNQICFERINEAAYEAYGEKIKKSVCKVAELLFEIDFAQKNIQDPKNGNIKSMSSGGQSVSFGNTDTLVSKAVSDKDAQEKLLYDAVMEYLGPTGLMYGGM